MKVNSSIFKAYDIRGVYPSNLDERVVFRIGQVFANYIAKAEGQKKSVRKIKIALAHDNRKSSPKLVTALTKGLRQAGADVVDIGLATTPMMYFSTAFLKCDGGVIITASHNPPEYNGLKFVGREAMPIIPIEQGIKEMVMSDEEYPSSRQGKMIKKDIRREYIKFTLKDIDLKKISPMKIAIDTANAVPGILVSEMFKGTKCKVKHFLKKLDGNFSVHTPNPLDPAAKQYIEERMREDKYDLGVAFDGDGDRILFLDENGNDIRPDIITALMSEILCRKKKKMKVYYDIRSSNSIPEAIRKSGGSPVTGRIGHTFIKQQMRRENIDFGGESSGHYYLKDHYYFESPIFVLFAIMEFLSEEKLPFSNAIAKYFTHAYSGELNFPVEDANHVLELAKNKYQDGKINTADGVRVDYPDWWFLIRASNTEPVIRLVVEADNGELLEQKINELKELIQG